MSVSLLFIVSNTQFGIRPIYYHIRLTAKEHEEEE